MTFINVDIQYTFKYLIKIQSNNMVSIKKKKTILSKDKIRTTLGQFAFFLAGQFTFSIYYSILMKLPCWHLCNYMDSHIIYLNNMKLPCFHGDKPRNFSRWSLDT